MERIDRKRLDAGTLPISFDVPVRFDDLDRQAHVNNAASVVMLQEARAHFNAVARLPELRGSMRMMVVALAVEYVGEMHYPGEVNIQTGVLAIGRSSITLGQRARQNGRATLYARAVLVMADEQGAAPVPDALRAAYECYLIPETR